MPLNLKQSVSEAGEIREAIRRRVSDEDNRDFTEREIENRIAQYVGADSRESTPRVFSGTPLFSHSWRNFNKDQKLYAGMLNGRASTLEEKIRTTSKENFGRLIDIQQEALTLDSLITEEEIKNSGGFTTVHYNSFVRTIDFDLGERDPRWKVDYKTGFSFLPNHRSNIIPGTGLTLPVTERVNVPITDVVLVGEETDVGDTKRPIVSNSPKNLLLKNKVFRHVIIRKEFDRTSRKYNKELSKVTLLLKLANVQLVNNLSIQPVGQSTLAVESLKYINSAGEEIELGEEVIPTETGLLVLFEPVRTRWLKVTLRQYAPVTKTQYNVKDWRVKQINEVLRGVGFTQLLDEKQEGIQGRVYDFSLESMAVGLYKYEPLGIFRSKNVKVESPLGLVLSDRSEKIRVTSLQGSYGVDFALPDDVVLNEYYIGANFRDANGNVVLRDLIPVPDSYPVQREYLPLIGGEARVKLFPDMVWDLTKTRVLSVTDTGFTATVTTETPHSLEIGTPVTLVFIGPDDHPLNGEIEVTPTDVDEMTFDTSGTVNDYTLTENTLPRAYLYVDADQGEPLTVSREGTALTIGTDYEMSIDDGETFFTSFPRGVEYIDALRAARSGRFIVKILKPELDKVYWVQYRPLKTQFLGNTDLVQLKNGRVIFDRQLQGTKGVLNTVIVSRADNDNPYVTPIIQFYALKVRENVS